MFDPSESTSAFLRRHPFGDTEFLFQRAGKGSERAWRAILERYYARLRLEADVRIPRHLRRFFDEDDVLAEAFKRAWNNRSAFRYQGEPAFRRWLALLISRELLRMIRSLGTELRRRTGESQIGGLGTAPARDDGQERSDDEELFLQALRHLTARERDLISMYHSEEMSFQGMAEVMGLSREQSRQRYLLAYERLEHWLRKLGGKDEGPE